jgi:SAM-dependent methyltransferase
MSATIKKFFLMIFDPVFLTHIRLKVALESVIALLAVGGVRCLDVGCGNRPYEYLFEAGNYVGVDVEDSGRPLNMKQPDYFYNGNTLPFPEGSFDMVMSTQVLEHVPNPSAVISEMARVCKLGGAVVISIPFVYQEHEEPFDYFRFTQYGIEELLTKAGLKLEALKKDSSALEAIAILINVYIMQNLVPNVRGLGRLYALFFCFPIQVLAMILSKILPDKGQLYLNLVVYAKKV